MITNDDDRRVTKYYDEDEYDKDSERREAVVMKGQATTSEMEVFGGRVEKRASMVVC